MTRPFVLLIVLSGCCKPAPTPDTDPTAVAPCVEPRPPSCPRSACGANSEAVNNFPTNGVRSNGECNYDGVQLLPGSMTGGAGGKCQGATLSVRDNKLIGLEPKDGSAKCTDKELQGASFALRSWVQEQNKYLKLTVHISDIDPAYRADNNQRARMAYRLTDDQGRSLCTAKASTEARQALGIEMYTGLTDPRPERDKVIAVRSELYNRDGHAWKVDPSWKLREPEWLHFACADDALAKRSLYNLDSDDVNASRSALMMFIANYCGDLHATSRGSEIDWEMADDVAGATTDPHLLEAKWGPDGAVCVANPRALYQAGEQPQVPQSPTGDLAQVAKICSSCTPSAWTDAIRSCQAWKSKHPPPKPVPSCDRCESDGCKGVLLHSYVVPKKAAP